MTDKIKYKMSGKMKQKTNFAFYVSGKASRLFKLIKLSSGVIRDTVLVVNDNAPNKQLSELLAKKRVHYVEFNYKNIALKGQSKNEYISELLLDNFKLHKIDYCFCFGRKILKGNLLKQYKNRIINFHPSILPMFPGERSIDQAISNKSFLLGNTAHFVDEGVDTGPVIMQSLIHNKYCFTYESVLGLQLPMIEQIYRWILEKRLVVVGNKVNIKKADYGFEIFYPKLEQKTLLNINVNNKCRIK